MKIFSLYGTQDYWSVHYKNERGIGGGGINDNYYLAECKGIPVAKNWTKVEVKIVFRGELGRHKPDIMDFGGLVSFAITSHTKDVLKDLILPYCELLPVDLSNSEIYIVNPTVILNCLDYDCSIMEPRPPLFKSKKIVKYVFRKDIDYPPIFRIVDSKFGIFANENLVERLEESGLIGYKVEELWDSEEEGI